MRSASMLTTMLLLMTVGSVVYGEEPVPAADDSTGAPPDTSEASLFRSEIAGIEIRKPDSWTFADLESVMEHRASVKLKDEEMERAMQALASVPLVAATRHPEPYERLNPSFQILVRPVAQLEGRKPIEVLGMVEPSLRNMFAEYETVDEAREIEVGGKPAARMTATYIVSTPDGTEFPTRSTIVMILRGKVLYQIGFSAPPEGDDAFTTEIEDILATVKFLD